MCDELPKELRERLQEKQRYIDIIQEKELGAYNPFEDKIKEPQKRSHSYNYKIKKTGLTAEATIYNGTILRGYERKHTPERGENRTMANEQNVKRARRNVYDIVNTNFTEYTKMITLTYAKTTLDYDQLYKDFKAFIKQCRRMGYRFPYLAITEHQTKRGKKEGNQGSLHIHALLFTDQYIPFKDLKKAWGTRGSVHIEKIDRAKNKGAYVAKYITKEAMPPDKKAYRCSRDIKKPTIMVGIGTELDVIHGLENEYKYVDTYDYTVERGANQETGEIVEDLKATVIQYEKD